MQIKPKTPTQFFINEAIMVVISLICSTAILGTIVVITNPNWAIGIFKSLFKL